MTPEEIVPDDQLKAASEYANFGSAQPREVLAYGLLQTACGYHTGGTVRAIMLDLKLVSIRRNPMKPPALLKRGREYLWAAFGRKSY